MVDKKVDSMVGPWAEWMVVQTVDLMAEMMVVMMVEWLVERKVVRSVVQWVEK